MADSTLNDLLEAAVQYCAVLVTLTRWQYFSALTHLCGVFLHITSTQDLLKVPVKTADV